jgi:hypothetical protein
MALCDGCKVNKHFAHTGHFSVPIGKGKRAKGTRAAECDCSQCVRREVRIAPSSKQPTSWSGWAPPRYTNDPCGKCAHPSHWVTGDATDGRCPGCPRCVASPVRMAVAA